MNSYFGGPSVAYREWTQKNSLHNDWSFLFYVCCNKFFVAELCVIVSI